VAGLLAAGLPSRPAPPRRPCASSAPTAPTDAARTSTKTITYRADPGEANALDLTLVGSTPSAMGAVRRHPGERSRHDHPAGDAVPRRDRPRGDVRHRRRTARRLRLAHRRRAGRPRRPGRHRRRRARHRLDLLRRSGRRPAVRRPRVRHPERRAGRLRRSLWRTQRRTGAQVPKTSRIALRSALAPSMTNSTPCSASRPRSTRSDNSAVATVAFSVEPSHSPSAIFTPSVLMPSATTSCGP
jgi:hypothetical protein